MPALPSAAVPILSLLAHRNAAANLSAAAPPSNVSGHDALQVICAWPVSGQYGPGSRVLYYVLVAACVVARKTVWLRNACLAAALLLPAIAAVHGIVLAAVHVPGAVDMDVYGAFQLCAIGILTAPTTTRLSRTYFNDPGRNTIFLWTSLLLAGLLSLTVEFLRINTIDCLQDGAGNPISTNAHKFPYGAAGVCSLACSPDSGPFSPLRKGSTNNIYVVPAPDKFSFGTVALLAAACCIPAVLVLASMWTKILEENWESRFGSDEGQMNVPIMGTNGATPEKMKRINTVIQSFLSVVEIIVIATAVLTILILGEMNFFSRQALYQTEPMASIGQWAPIAGTGFAALGSFQLLLAKDADSMKKEEMRQASSECNCTHHHHDGSPQYFSPRCPTGEATALNSNGDALTTPGHESAAFESGVSPSNVSFRSVNSQSYAVHRENASDLEPTPAADQAGQPSQADPAGRRMIARWMTAASNRLGTAAHDLLDTSEKDAGEFPEIPGELNRNPLLFNIKKDFKRLRDRSVQNEQRSRAASANGRAASVRDADSPPRRPRSPSPSLSAQSLHYDTSQASSRSSKVPHFPPAATARSGRTSSEPRLQQRRPTLKVPGHRSPLRNSMSSPAPSVPITIPGGHNSPDIVVSPDLGAASPASTIAGPSNTVAAAPKEPRSPPPIYPRQLS